MTKNETTSLVTLDSPYKALTVADNFTTILEENLGGASIDPSELPQVKMPSGGGLFWTIPTVDGDEGAKEITGIVVAWKEHRAYWPRPLDEGVVPPDCSSHDGKIGHAKTAYDPTASFSDNAGMAESGGAPYVLWQEHDGVQACGTCPFAQFGSGKNGAPACTKSRTLFILRTGELLPLRVTLSPMSVKVVSDFFLRLTSRMIPLSHVEIGLALEKVNNSVGTGYSRVVPKLLRTLNDDEGRAMDAYAAQIRPLLQQAKKEAVAA